MRVVFLGAADSSAAAHRPAALVITPRNDGVELLEFQQLERTREAGRTAPPRGA